MAMTNAYPLRWQVLASLLAFAVAFIPAQRAGALTQSEIANYTGADRQAMLEAGAKTEGKLTLYTALTVNQAVRPLVEAFQKKYPFLKVDYWRGETREILAKVTAERQANKVTADIIEMGSGASAAIKAGAVEPFNSPSLADLPADYYDPQHLWVSTRLITFGNAYNTRMVKPGELKTYEDLLNPKWKGQMIWRADTDIGAPMFIANVIATMGRQKGEEYLAKLAKQQIVESTASARAMVDSVGQGEYAIAIQAPAYHPVISKGKGAPLDVEMMEPVPVNIATIQFVKGAPRPHAAMLFIDFILSQEGQTILQQADYIPSNPKVRPGPGVDKIVPRVAGLKERIFDPDTLAEQRNEMIGLLKKYFK
jgi:ABC-type Fe3+ transport system substrate-binding protein